MKTFVNLIVNFVIVLIALTVHDTYGNVRNSLKMVKTNCIVPDRIEIINISCWAKSINRTHAVGNVRLFLTKPLNNLFIEFQLYKKNVVKYKPFLLNIKDDYCAFYTKNQGSKYMRIIHQMYMPYSNLNHSCPYYGSIVIKDLVVDPHLLPSMWPNGDYRLDVNVYNYDTLKFTMEFYMEIRELSYDKLTDNNLSLKKKV